MRLAFFDVDYTLYNGFTVVQFQTTFAKKYHREEVMLKRQQLEFELKNGTVSHQILVERSMNLAAQAVKGLSVDIVSQDVRKLIKSEGKFFSWVQPLLDYLRTHNFMIYLISASIEPMIEEIARLLKVDHYFATILEQLDGVYTGNVSYVRNGSSKLETLNSIIGELREKNDVIAFGDSDGDVAMLSAADQGFVVNPVEFSDNLMVAAKKHDWPVLRHETAFKQVKQKLTEKFGL